MGVWQKQVRTAVLQYTGGQPGTEFTRQGLIRFALAEFQSRFPNAKTPAQTLSRELQGLRDDGILEFVSRGRYRLLVDADRLTEPTAPPTARPGRVRVRPGQVKTRPFQYWLRSYVLPNFGHRCGICGLTPEWFLDAAHLRPVGKFPALAGDPTAVVALCKNHHQALDVGALVIEPNLRIRVDAHFFPRRSAELDRVIFSFDGARLRTPTKWPLNSEALPSIPIHKVRRDPG